MTSKSRPASRAALILGLVFALLPGRTTHADNLPEPADVEGLSAGPFLIMPSLAIGVSRETNPFYEPVPQGDTVGRLNPRLGVMLPFSHSYFRILYDGIFRRYHDLAVTDPDSHDFAAELSLLFSSSDRFVVLATQTAGASEVLRFDGGETTYNGTPFHYTTITTGAQRVVPGHLGYEVAVAWSKLVFDETDLTFFNFQGYDAAADMNIPASPQLWFVVGGGIRRFDHMLSNDPTQVFRREESDLARFGVRGVLGSRGTYRAILAYDRSVYPGGLGSNFSGIMLDGEFVFAIGPSTSLTVTAGRRPWSSFYGDNNYYIANTIGAAVQHTLATGVSTGGSVRGGVSAYPDPVNIAAGGPLRRDRDLAVDAFVEFPLPHKCAARATYDLQLRRSNEPVGYTAQSLSVQFVVGWR